MQSHLLPTGGRCRIWTALEGFYWDRALFADFLDEITVELSPTALGLVRVTGRGCAAGGTCPGCGRFAARVHDTHQRRPRDLPLGDHPVVLALRVRRFICDNATSPRRTLAEQFATVTAPYARRLHAVVERIGLALAGRAGARLAAVLAIPASRMTLLRRVTALPDPALPVPRVLGVDDFANRRGQTYSTVLTCGETHRVVDVPPTREAGPLAAWPTTHPGVEIICRDRAGAYAEGARLGATGALQIADRFHLWQNLGRAAETCIVAHRDCLRTAQPSCTIKPG
ncbi:ISL3 family transposase [Streptomyces sp. NPDC001904]|uniref:ISL3 family transposase n=1 Tax=Streptomyces sp. NPDC001904 TaxID=3154531 RepID=UPI00331EF770